MGEKVCSIFVLPHGEEEHMHYPDHIQAETIHWLLEPRDPGVRYLALRDLCDLPPDDPEMATAREAATRQGPIALILDSMDPEGYWVEPGPGYLPKYTSGVWAVLLLAELGARLEDDPRIARACAYMLEHTLTKGGQFTSTGAPSGTADCLQGNLCWALTVLGVTGPRLDTAYDWMARSVTGDGVSPAKDRKAAIRYYAGKCGPTFACGANNGLPCAWGAVKVMRAFACLPASRRTPRIDAAVQAGLDFLLSTDPALAQYPSGYSEKPSGNWWKFGFPVFYVTDILQIAEAVAGLGYGRDPRLANALDLILSKQDKLGRWALDYHYAGKTYGDYGEKKMPNKWVTLRAMQAFKAVSSLA
jgi:hypothetical protein